MQVQARGDFGIAGKFNPQNAQLFQQALNAFVDDPATLHIAGTYRGAPTILNVQPQSGLAVLQQEGGQFISGWKLKADQLANVLMRGSL
ncbi:colicin D domain-containing protein [Mycolicibacterium fluoranthenivorans]|uniref:colicin D domain-containing protein n=1 Tax=Mycolicibacterium fluoranthenivorans TaxID=258505 RepID=UPI0039A262DB